MILYCLLAALVGWLGEFNGDGATVPASPLPDITQTVTIGTYFGRLHPRSATDK
jgi:hypothetical protein